MSEFRLQRLEHQFAEQISVMLARGMIKDPRVSEGLSVSKVSLTKDTQFGKVYISCFDDDQDLDRSVEALNHAAGFIQHVISKNIKLRNTPKLTFIADRSIKFGIEMSKKLEDLDS